MLREKYIKGNVQRGLRKVFIEKVWESTCYTVFHGCLHSNQSSGTEDLEKH